VIETIIDVPQSEDELVYNGWRNRVNEMGRERITGGILNLPAGYADSDGFGGQSIVVIVGHSQEQVHIGPDLVIEANGFVPALMVPATVVID
jgi:hypothetical protein